MGLFGSIGKVLGGVVRTVAPIIGGPIGGAIGGVVGRALGSGGGGAAPVPLPLPVLQSGGGAPRLSGGPGGAVVPYQGAVSPLGTVGMCPTELVYTRSGQVRKWRLKKGGGCTWHKKPTMNVMNQRAASRATTRIKGARNLLQRIESALPRRKASGKGCGCGKRR